MRAIAAVLTTLTLSAADLPPILASRCAPCHTGAAAQGGLDVQSLAAILKGGKSGPAVQPGAPARSLLFERVVSKTMPPTPPKLTDAEVATLRTWIEQLPPAPAALVTEADVLPVFQMRCTVCHGKRKQEAGLDLRTRASILKGGKSGPVLIPGKPDESPLMKRILAGQMPPPKLLFEYFVRPPSSPEVDLVRRWIAAGAPPAPPEAAAPATDPLVTPQHRQWWAFQPPRRPTPPTVSHADRVRNPIDAFLLARLEAKSLSYNEEAAPNVLLRRLYLDLTGLPPTADETLAYERDTASDRYEKLVDRLLGSRAYAERWAQFWLNAAGYSDSEGIIDEDKLRPNAWRYRDYVIRSLHEGKPYDQFLTEQLAGDELSNYKSIKNPTQADLDKLTATGFLRLVPDGTYSPANGSVPERMNVIADEIEVLASGVMGLTVGCARCHNHKYDPIPQRDYYRFAAILQSAFDPYDWVKPTERNIDLALPAEREAVAKWNDPIEAEIKARQAELDRAAKPLREELLKQRLATLPEGVRADLAQTAATPEKERTSLQTYLADKFKDTLKITDEELGKLSPDHAKQSAAARKEIATLRAKLKPKPDIRALYEMGGAPSPVHLLRRGDANNLGEAVRPQPPSVVADGLQPYDPAPPYEGATGRRLALARWLTQPNHPLTARVMVNRMWMHHFGRGIVASPANFGKLGVAPTHPELLDWLATEFVRGGWNIKAMHRLMVTSTAYRQSTAIPPAAQAADPDNLLLSRMTLRRMDAEQLHDSVLAVTGQLDPTPFGEPVLVDTAPGGEIVAKPTAGGWRRSIYVLQRRTTPMSALEVFDLPPMSPNCIERSYSTVSTQALQMMNSEAIRERARYLAGRLIDQHPADRAAQVQDLYLRALSRRPTAEETTRAVADIERLTKLWRDHSDTRRTAAPRLATAEWSALASLCHALLASAQFAYID